LVSPKGTPFAEQLDRLCVAITLSTSFLKFLVPQQPSQLWSRILRVMSPGFPGIPIITERATQVNHFGHPGKN
jgi:hypothetical protein